MITLTGISRWLPLALCVSMTAVLLAGCGSETPATSRPTSPATPTALPADGSPHPHADGSPRLHADGSLHPHADGSLRLHVDGSLRLHDDDSPRLHADGSSHPHTHRPWHICGNTTTHSGAYIHFAT